MSKFENYTISSKTYDNFRQCVGLKEIVQRIKIHFLETKKQTDLKILDAGCGTGTYLHALSFALPEAQLFGLEYNEGMKDKASYKLNDKANIVQGSMTDMPFGNNTFDVVLTTQTFHHLDADSDIETKPKVHIALTEFKRVLDNKGLLIINVTTEIQQRKGFWWGELIPNAVAHIGAKMPTSEWLIGSIYKAGFYEIYTHTPTEPLVPLNIYLNILGPFDPLYRKSDSTWTLATKEELDGGLSKLRSIIKDKKETEFLALKEIQRKECGQSSTFYAYSK